MLWQLEAYPILSSSRLAPVRIVQLPSCSQIAPRMHILYDVEWAYALDAPSVEVRGGDAVLDSYRLLRDHPLRPYHSVHAVLSLHVLVLSSILDLRTL